MRTLLTVSQGEDFGEDGYFRMVRGKDAYGIESMAVALTVIDPIA